MSKGEENKEDFCGACAAIPIALAGAGLAGASGKGSRKKEKKILLWTGLGTIFLAIMIAVFFLFIKKCSDCR